MKLVESENEKENIEDLYKVGNVIKYRGQTYMVILIGDNDDCQDDCKYGLLHLGSGRLVCGAKDRLTYDSLPELIESCGSDSDELLTGKVTFDMED